MASSRRLDSIPDSAKLTREEAADLLGCSVATVAARNYAGLLPYSPTRPIRVLAKHVKIVAKMTAGDLRKKLHLGFRIPQEEMPVYCRLDGAYNLNGESKGTNAIIGDIIAKTNKLFLASKADKKRQAKDK